VSGNIRLIEEDFVGIGAVSHKENISFGPLGTNPSCEVKLQVGRGEYKSNKVPLSAGYSCLTIFPKQ